MADVIIRGVTYTGVNAIDAQADGGGTQSFIIPNGTIPISQNGLASVAGYAYANVNVSGGGSAYLVNIDFTQAAESFTANNVNVSNAGAYFNTGAAYFYVPFIGGGRTIEIDVASSAMATGANHRFVMRNTTDGFGWHNANGKWGFYSNSAWATDTTITDVNYFNNSTVKIFIDSSNYWHIYKDGTLIYEPNRAGAPVASWIIGSTGTSVNGMTITGLRVY